MIKVDWIKPGQTGIDGDGHVFPQPPMQLTGRAFILDACG
jgi:hypothetical protein